MLTEEIGQYYLRTQHELGVIKQQLDSLPAAERNGPQAELLQGLYQKVQESINQIQGNIQQNTEFFFNQVMGNFDHTIQRLPGVIDERDQDKSNVIRAHSSRRKNRVPQQVNLPIIDSLVQLKGQASLNFRPLGKASYSAKGIHSISKQTSSQTLLQKKPSKFLIKPVVSEKDIAKEGLIGLINKGRLMNGQEAETLLNVKNGLFRNSQVKQSLHPFKESLTKQQIMLEHENQTDMVKFDLPREVEPIQEVIETKTFQKATSHQVLQSRIIMNRHQVSLGHNDNQTKFEAMSVNQVMDQFSLHNFMIRKGRVVDEALEFQSFKRSNQSIWPQIANVIRSLEKIAAESNIALATVNGKQLIETAIRSTNRLLTLEELVTCFMNDEDFILKLRLAKLMFKGTSGRIRAIVKIQSIFRMWRAQRDYARLRVMVEKVKVIQSAVRTFLLYRSTRRIIQKRNLDQFEQFRKRQEEFKSNWPIWKLQPRVEVHTNNFSFEESRRLTMEKFLQRQNAQITRVFALRDPLLSIVYVAPFDLPNEIMNYFYKILELAEIPNFRERLHFVWPENHLTFPSHSSTGRILLYSPRCLKRIKAILKNRNSYIVPGYPSNDDIKLSHYLQIPIYSGEPQNQLVNSTKSGSKRLFQELQIPCPPGAYEIYDEKELINTLAILITSNPQVPVWLLKIDDECQGRGIASIEVRKLGHYFKDASFAQAPDAIVQVASILHQRLPQKINICYPHLFTTYAEFMSAFTHRGGIVEACPANTLSSIDSPSLFFRVEPDGKVEILGTFDKIRVNHFQTVACLGPKKSLPNINVQYLCQSVGEKLYAKGIFGYMQLDLIAFSESSSNLIAQKNKPSSLFWALGLDCYLTTMSCSCFYFDILMRGKLDPMTGHYSIAVSDTSSKGDVLEHKRSYLYCPLIINEGLDALQYKTFFQLCRLESISFNLEKKLGATFILIDSLQSAVLSVMTVGDGLNSVLKYMTDALEFLAKHVGRGHDQNDPFESRNDKIKMMAILQKLKLQLKKSESALAQSKSMNHISNIYL